MTPKCLHIERPQNPTNHSSGEAENPLAFEVGSFRPVSHRSEISRQKSSPRFWCASLGGYRLRAGAPTRQIPTRPIADEGSGTFVRVSTVARIRKLSFLTLPVRTTVDESKSEKSTRDCAAKEPAPVVHPGAGLGAGYWQESCFENVF